MLTMKPSRSADQRDALAALPRGENVLAPIVGPDRLTVKSEEGFLLGHVDERGQVDHAA